MRLPISFRFRSPMRLLLLVAAAVGLSAMPSLPWLSDVAAQPSAGGTDANTPLLGAAFVTKEVCRIHFTGSGLDAAVAVQRMNEVTTIAAYQAQLGNTMWDIVRPRRAIASEVLEPGHAPAITAWLEAARAIKLGDELGVNTPAQIPANPWLHVTLTNQKTLEKMALVHQMTFDSAMWNVMSQILQRQNNKTVDLRMLANALRNQVAPAAIVGWLQRHVDRGLTGLWADGDPNWPPIDHKGKQRPIRGFTIDVDPDAKSRELDAELEKAVPNGRKLASELTQRLNQARGLAPAEFEKVLETQTAAFFDRMAERVEVVIMAETDGGGYRALTSASQPPLGKWYRVSKADAEALRVKAGAFKLPPLPAPPPAKIVTAPALPRVKLVTTAGEIVVELFEDDVPNTVANFVSLVEKGFYDGVRVHRLIAGFMLQSGDPTTKAGIGPDAGSGGPGYRFDDELNEKSTFDREGRLAMANAGRNTNGSQFFITFAPTPQLNTQKASDGTLERHYTLFGQVVEGMDVVKKLEGTPVAPNHVGELSRPLTQIIIRQAFVVQKRGHDYKPVTK